jgi:ARG and Rhodanese-Phosphatase-superfamily-associated Protein domain
MIEASIQLGDPVEHRGIVIAPLYPRNNPTADYLTLEEALPLGFQITEIDEAGSVPELLAFNPLDRAVLLYDGEELLGAKQNRILNVTVLVAAQSETRIPVSCVEQGRWHARSANFASAPHAAYPDLRRHKAEQLSAEPLAHGLAQATVWEDLAAKAGRHGVHSPTGAAADIYLDREAALAELRHAFPRAPGQSGALLALGEGQLCLDYLSRPGAFAHLYHKLLDGYLLDALEHLDSKPAPRERMASFLASASAAPTRLQSSAGVGDDLRLAGDGLVGSGLILEEELLQLSVFTYAGNTRRTRVARPSRRH